MPHIHKNKSRNNSRNSSQKSTASSQGKPVAVTITNNEDDGFSVLIKPTKKSTPKNNYNKQNTKVEVSEPAPVETTPPPPPRCPWEELGMTEEEFNAMQQRVHQQMMEDMRKTYIDNMLAELDDPRYWNRRIERLEQEREYFNKKRGWSAADIACVNQIDEDIKECEDELERIHSEIDRLEYEYD